MLTALVATQVAHARPPAAHRTRYAQVCAETETEARLIADLLAFVPEPFRADIVMPVGSQILEVEL